MYRVNLVTRHGVAWRVASQLRVLSPFPERPLASCGPASSSQLFFCVFRITHLAGIYHTSSAPPDFGVSMPKIWYRLCASCQRAPLHTVVLGWFDLLSVYLAGREAPSKKEGRRGLSREDAPASILPARYYTRIFLGGGLFSSLL